jgi:hypothetical protein
MLSAIKMRTPRVKYAVCVRFPETGASGSSRTSPLSRTGTKAVVWPAKRRGRIIALPIAYSPNAISIQGILDLEITTPKSCRKDLRTKADDTSKAAKTV